MEIMPTNNNRETVNPFSSLDSSAVQTSAPVNQNYVNPYMKTISSTAEEEPQAENWVRVGDAADMKRTEAEKQVEFEKKRHEARYGDIEALMGDAIAAEAARDASAEQNLQNPEYVETINSDPNGSGKVQYSNITTKERKKAEDDNIFETGSDFDESDLIPSYEEFEEEVPEAEDKAAPDPTNTDAYGKYIRGLEVSKVQPANNAVVKEVKSRAIDVKTVPRDRMRSAGDQSFLNAVTKFKKDNFAVVTVPLVNSGFTANIVGTGVVDLNNLYLQVDQNTTMMDYQSEQMKVIMKNIVGTNPKINPNDLRNQIHFQDFQMMAFGHICATLREVETVTNCSECGKPFRITSRPYDLLMNMDELSERATIIDNASSVEEVSLLSKNTTLRTEDNIYIYLGHPSYAEAMRMMSSFKNYSKDMSQNEARRFNNMLTVLYMIRKIELPSGMISSNIYQNYMALGLLSQEDLVFLQKETEKMYKDIVSPKFGIKEVECPHCKKMNSNIAYENLADLLFYHTTVSSYLERPEG